MKSITIFTDSSFKYVHKDILIKAFARRFPDYEVNFTPRTERKLLKVNAPSQEEAVEIDQFFDQLSQKVGTIDGQIRQLIFEFKQLAPRQAPIELYLSDQAFQELVNYCKQNKITLRGTYLNMLIFPSTSELSIEVK